MNKLIPIALITASILLFSGVIDFGSGGGGDDESSEVDLVVLQKLVLQEVAWEIERSDSKLRTLNDVFDCLNLTVARVKKGKESKALDSLRLLLGEKIDAAIPPTIDSSGDAIDVVLTESQRDEIARILREVADA